MIDLHDLVIEFDVRLKLFENQLFDPYSVCFDYSIDAIFSGVRQCVERNRNLEADGHVALEVNGDCEPDSLETAVELFDINLVKTPIRCPETDAFSIFGDLRRCGWRPFGNGGLIGMD